MNVQNYHLFIVRYLHQTERHSPRVQIESLRPTNKGQKITFEFTDVMSNKEEEAIKALEERGFNIIGTAEGYKMYGDVAQSNISYIISDTFKQLTK